MNNWFVNDSRVVEAILDSRFKHRESEYKNCKRMIYESVDNNDDRFEVMLNDEIGKIRTVNRYAERDCRI